jgi:hypothetical protein
MAEALSVGPMVGAGMRVTNGGGGGLFVGTPPLGIVDAVAADVDVTFAFAFVDGGGAGFDEPVRFELRCVVRNKASSIRSYIIVAQSTN